MVVVGGSNPGHPGRPLQCGGGSQPSNHEHDDFDEKIYCVAMVKKNGVTTQFYHCFVYDPLLMNELHIQNA